jgi:hypothetical protein
MLVLLIIDWQGLVAQRASGEDWIDGIIAQSRVQGWFQTQFDHVNVWCTVFAYDDISLTPLIGESRGDIVGHRFWILVSQELQRQSLWPIIRVNDPLVCLLAIVTQDRTQMRNEPLVMAPVLHWVGLKRRPRWGLYQARQQATQVLQRTSWR